MNKILFVSESKCHDHVSLSRINSRMGIAEVSTLVFYCFLLVLPSDHIRYLGMQSVIRARWDVVPVPVMCVDRFLCQRPQCN